MNDKIQKGSMPITEQRVGNGWVLTYASSNNTGHIVYCFLIKEAKEVKARFDLGKSRFIDHTYLNSEFSSEDLKELGVLIELSRNTK